MTLTTAAIDPPDGNTHRTTGLQQRFSVQFNYPVEFTDDIFSPCNETLARSLTRIEPLREHRVMVVVDSGVAIAWPGIQTRIQDYFHAHAHRLKLAGSPLTIEGGERVKNDHELISELQESFFVKKLDRHSAVLIIGGGAVLDAVGYAAAVTHRGLRVVRIPTTVLAQNDAGIGVKNGINRFESKNALGCFAPPFAVINDFAFISTLTRRDRIAGVAEAVKVALVRDEAFFNRLEADACALARGESVATRHMIRRCAELHLAHIKSGGDPFESGSARPLDFGHWAAHKLEILSQHRLRHGEAVAIGLAIDCRYSERIGRLTTRDAVRVESTLARLGLPTWHEALESVGPSGERSVLAGLEEFREHLGGDLTVTMLDGIGKGFEIHDIDRPTMRSVLDELCRGRRG